MPDENSNPISTQASQNDQVVTNQSWNDFVLDFGDDEIKNEVNTSSIETPSLENDKIEDEWWDVENLDLSGNFLDEEKKEDKWDAVEGDVKMENEKIDDEKSDNEEFDNDFEISFDKMPEEKDTNEVSDEKENVLDFDDNSDDKIDENRNMDEWLNDNEEGWLVENQNNWDIAWSELIEDNENNLFINQSSTENSGENVVSNDEWFIFDNELGEGENEMSLNEDTGDIIGEWTENNDSNTDNMGIDFKDVVANPTENMKDDTFLMDVKSNEEEKSNDNVNLDLSEKTTSNNLENDREQENFTEVVNSSENDWSQEIPVDDIGKWENGWDQGILTETVNSSENDWNQGIPVGVVSDGVNDWDQGIFTEVVNNSENNWNQDISMNDVNNLENDWVEYLKQPEISDLLWDSPVEFSLETTEENIIGNEEKSWNEVQNDDEIKKEQENSDIVDVNEKSGFLEGHSESSVNNNEVNKDTLINNYEKNDWNVINEERDEINLPEKSSENVQDVVEWWVEMNVKTNIVDTEKSSENVSVAGNNMTSTLSLDEILDTELNNNPQFADNSKAVPVNVMKRNWLFGNKMMWVVAWVWIFLLAWLTVVLAFPPRNSDRKPWSVVNTGESVEINVDYNEDEYSGHNIAESITGTVDWQWIIDQYWWETIPHTTKTTVQQPDFPDVWWEDESAESSDDMDWWNPVPYVCDWENCTDNNGWWMESTYLKLWDVMSVISDFKSQADIYYSQWDEMQDKKLIKYSLQMIALCNNYQEQVENGEWLDEVNFSLFKSRWEVLLDKMEKYLIWEDYNDYFQNVNGGNNFNEEELRNYINERDSY